MTITATEFKSNLGKYLTLVKNEDINITRNGKEIARLTGPVVSKMMALDLVTGVISENDFPTDYKAARVSKQ